MGSTPALGYSWIEGKPDMEHRLAAVLDAEPRKMNSPHTRFIEHVLSKQEYTEEYKKIQARWR